MCQRLAASFEGRTVEIALLKEVLQLLGCRVEDIHETIKSTIEAATLSTAAKGVDLVDDTDFEQIVRLAKSIANDRSALELLNKAIAAQVANEILCAAGEVRKRL